MDNAPPRIGVGAVIWRGPDALLLVRRGKAPRLGEWSLPGGGVEPGETLREALSREVAEETGLSIEIGDLIDMVDLIHRDEAGAVSFHYVLADFSARWRSGEAVAASDVTDCKWVAAADALKMVDWDETRRIIRLSAKLVWGMDL